MANSQKNRDEPFPGWDIREILRKTIFLLLTSTSSLSLYTVNLFPLTIAGFTRVHVCPPKGPLKSSVIAHISVNTIKFGIVEKNGNEY